MCSLRWFGVLSHYREFMSSASSGNLAMVAVVNPGGDELVKDCCNPKGSVNWDGKDCTLKTAKSVQLRQ